MIMICNVGGTASYRPIFLHHYFLVILTIQKVSFFSYGIDVAIYKVHVLV